uniref:Uncharacterized protein n=1 Tax=Nomascus leucogenys TaxID=61853 RepID=A0A2I3FZY4_NOMLE
MSPPSFGAAPRVPVHTLFDPGSAGLGAGETPTTPAPSDWSRGWLGKTAASVLPFQLHPPSLPRAQSWDKLQLPAPHCPPPTPHRPAGAGLVGTSCSCTEAPLPQFCIGVEVCTAAPALPRKQLCRGRMWWAQAQGTGAASQPSLHLPCSSRAPGTWSGWCQMTGTSWTPRTPGRCLWS